MQPTPVARLARIGAPTLVAALLVTGVAVAASPSAQQEVLAEPAAPTSTAAVDTAARDARANRGTSRDALTPGDLAAKADAAAATAKEAKAKKAAADKAAKKAAEKVATEKKKAAARKKAAADKAAAEKAAAAKKAADAKAVAAVSGARYTTVDLNVRTQAGASANVRTVLTSGAKVSVTQVKDGKWQQVVTGERAGWVLAEYLAAKKPVAKKATSEKSGSSDSSSSSSSRSSSSISDGACSSSSVESGLTPDAIRVHRAICAKFPQVKSFGGVRADSLPEHPSGRALDAMISNSSVGWQIANWVRDNRVALGVSEVLYSQKIWTVQRGSEGWRSFSDRGSATANHYDHVHITVYGNSGNG